MEKGFQEELQDYISQYIDDDGFVLSFSSQIVHKHLVDSETVIVPMTEVDRRGRIAIHDKHETRYVNAYEYAYVLDSQIRSLVYVAFDWFTNTLYIKVGEPQAQKQK